MTDAVLDPHRPEHQGTLVASRPRGRPVDDDLAAGDVHRVIIGNPDAGHNPRRCSVGTLYLAGKHNDDILMYDADSGGFLGQLVAPGLGGLDGPRGLLILPPSHTCPGDLDGSGDVGVDDLIQVITAWGPCDAP